MRTAHSNADAQHRNRMESQGARLLLDVFLFLITSVYYVLEACFLTLVPLRFRCDPDRLRGHVALVTGGAGGVGRHLCVKLALRGCTVVIWDVNQKGQFSFFLLFI
jgi:NAD dependent epimerase/dehydratase family